MATEERVVRSPVVDTWRRAQLAEIVWRDPDGRPDASAAIPLLDGRVPCLALPYGDLELARALSEAAEVVIGVTAAPADGTPAVLARGRAEVTSDPDGIAFQELGLLEQELHKHPPSRRRLDSMLLRREHWWYVPRLLVRIRGITNGHVVDPGDALLAVGGSSLTVRSCHLDVRGSEQLAAEDVRLRGDASTVAAVAETVHPAMILAHGGDRPDLDRPWQRRWYGTLDREGFTAHTVDGHGPVERPLSLRERLRAEAALATACKRGLRATADG